MKALITGSEGFVGQHLKNRLEKEKNLEVICWSRGIVDLRKGGKVYELFNHIRPDYVFHLAASPFVKFSFDNAAYVIDNNVRSTLNLLESIRNSGVDTVFHFAGSSEEYGLVDDIDLPVDEDTPLKPLSPYAVSKIAGDYLCYQYSKTYNMKIIRTRAFNHTGYGRGEMYAESNFAKQLIKIKKGKQEPIIRVGNLDAVRDYSDVRDIVEAYWLAVTKCPSDVYNISSKNILSIRAVLTKLIQLANVSVEITTDPSRIRASDVPRLEANSSKFRRITGWEPRYKIDDTLRSLLKYWEERI